MTARQHRLRHGVNITSTIDVIDTAARSRSRYVVGLTLFMDNRNIYIRPPVQLLSIVDVPTGPALSQMPSVVHDALTANEHATQAMDVRTYVVGALADGDLDLLDPTEGVSRLSRWGGSLAELLEHEFTVMYDGHIDL